MDSLWCSSVQRKKSYRKNKIDVNRMIHTDPTVAVTGLFVSYTAKSPSFGYTDNVKIGLELLYCPGPFRVTVRA